MKFLLTLCLVTMAASAISAKNLPRARTNGNETETAEEPEPGCQSYHDCVTAPLPEQKCPFDVFCDYNNEFCSPLGMCISKYTGCVTEAHGCYSSSLRFPTYTCQHWGGCCDAIKKECLPTTYDHDADPLGLFQTAECKGSWDAYDCDFFQVSRTSLKREPLQYGCSYDAGTTHHYCWRQETYGSSNWCWGIFDSEYRRCDSDSDCEPEDIRGKNMYCEKEESN